MLQYVTRFVDAYPELMDLVAADDDTTVHMSESPSVRFSPHISIDQITVGIKSRQLFRGTIHPVADSWTNCYVILHNADSTGRRSVKVIGEQKQYAFDIP